MVKKIALPVLAIGAVVLTGGAALGILPALGAGGLGLSAGLASIVTSAGTGALLGGATALVTGKNVLKGMTTGGLVGAATGGIGQLIRPAASAGSTIAANAAKGANAAIDAGIASNAAQITGSVAPTSAAVTGGSGIGSLIGGADKLASNVARGSAAAPTVNANAATEAARGTVSGGIGGFLKDQPYLLPSVLQGIGSGISASAQAKSESKRERRERERIEANYAGSGDFYQPSAPSYGPGPARPRPIWKIDPISGQLYRDVEAA